MFDLWNPRRLIKHKPWVSAFVGARRTGKSYAMAHMTEQFKAEFDLVISFCGSMSCSDELKTLFDTHFDPRFMFDTFSVAFLTKLREQQEELKREGRKREVLLLFDDVEMDSSQLTALGFFATRGRHFNVSFFYCSVSYTSIPKNFRRSLDCLLLFSIPMSSDRKLLLQEYAQSPHLADFCMKNLEPYQALVLESGHKQTIFTYKVHDDHYPASTEPVEPTESQNSTDEGLDQSGSEERLLLESEPRETGTLDGPNTLRAAESAEASEPGSQKESKGPAFPG